MKKEKRLKQCPICKEKTKEIDYGHYVEIICYNCNVAPIIIGYYTKKRKTDK
jgi:hypothetical protein